MIRSAKWIFAIALLVAVWPTVVVANTALPRLKEIPIFKERLNAHLKSQTAATAEAYFSAIDDYVSKALDLGWTQEQVNAQLDSLSDLAPTMPEPSYEISRLLTNDRILYFAEYRVSFWAGSTIRIFQSSGGHFTVTFKFTPLAYESLGIEEYASVESILWTGKEVLFVVRCIGEMSGYSPPGSLFVWSYDSETMRTAECLRLLHKHRLSVRPLRPWNLDLTVEYCPLADGEVDRVTTYQETYEMKNGKYQLAQRKCVKICDAPFAE
jgi:hypothetical protein